MIEQSAYEDMVRTADFYQARNKEARDEVSRLRDALSRIADVSERWEQNLARQVNEIARAALEEEK